MKNKHSGIVHLVSIKESKEQFFAANGNELESPLLDFVRSNSHENQNQIRDTNSFKDDKLLSEYLESSSKYESYIESNNQEVCVEAQNGLKAGTKRAKNDVFFH